MAAKIGLIKRTVLRVDVIKQSALQSNERNENREKVMEKESIKYKILLTLSIAAAAAVFFLLALRFYDNSDAVYKYSLLEDGTVTIDGYTGNPSKLEVPEKLDGYTVSAVSESAFANKTDIKKVVLPESVNAIGAYAFYGCTGLKSVKAVGVETVGFSAFYGCTDLKKVEWSDRLQSIGDSAFARCIRLQSLKIPASCKEIGTDAFLSCESLTLDCSENEAAAAAALQYGIPTGFTESSDWVLLKAGLLTLVAVIALGGLYLLVKRFKKNKKNQKRA